MAILLPGCSFEFLLKMAKCIIVSQKSYLLFIVIIIIITITIIIISNTLLTMLA